MERLPIASLIDDEAPEPPLGASCPEMGEVEREDREPLPLRHRHHACVHEAELEIGKGRIDLHGTAAKTGGESDCRVLVRNDR